MIFGVFFLNLCGKLASQFSKLSLQCQDLQAFALEKPKQRFSGNLWISVSGVKKRPQNKSQNYRMLLIHLGYFFILQPPQCWGGMTKAGTETQTATSLFLHVL